MKSLLLLAALVFSFSAQAQFQRGGDQGGGRGGWDRGGGRGGPGGGWGRGGDGRGGDQGGGRDDGRGGTAMDAEIRAEAVVTDMMIAVVGIAAAVAADPIVYAFTMVLTSLVKCSALVMERKTEIL